MKTAEEILKRHLCSKCEGNLVMSVNDIGAIQLDAFKAGAEWAAKICFESARVKLSQEVHDIGNLILGETSEINELPK